MRLSFREWVTFYFSRNGDGSVRVVVAEEPGRCKSLMQLWDATKCDDY